jgi:glucokinase
VDSTNEAYDYCDLSREKGFTIGANIGITSTIIAVVDNGEVIIEDYFKTKDCKTGDEIVEKIAAAANGLKTQVTEACPNWHVRGIGIGVPGSVDTKKGTIYRAGNLPFAQNQKMAKPVSTLTGLRTLINNDANAAAWGEFLHGAGKDYKKSLVYIGLGNGLGVGRVKNGKIDTGDTIANEFGHHIINFADDAELCTCIPGEKDEDRKRGCFEAHASAWALVRDTKRAMLNDRASLMWTYCGGGIKGAGKATILSCVNAKTAFDCAAQGDKTAQMVVDNFIKYVSIGSHNAAVAFGPEAIIIGGGISNEGDKLIDPVRDFVTAKKFPTGQDIAVLKSGLGHQAGVVGAAALFDKADK